MSRQMGKDASFSCVLSVSDPAICCCDGDVEKQPVVRIWWCCRHVKCQLSSIKLTAIFDEQLIFNSFDAGCSLSVKLSRGHTDV